MKETSKVVAITGLHRGDNPQPGAAVIRSLRRAHPDLRIVGLSYDPMESGLFSHGGDHVDVAYSLPFPASGADRLRERLGEILALDRFDVVIPCLDSELANFIEIAPFLRDWGIAAILPSPDALGKRAKEKLGEFCEGNHIPCPRTVTGFDIETLLRAAEDLGYPLFIKGRLYEGKLVHDRAELSSFAGELFEKWGGPVLAQRAIVGEEYCYTGFASPRSEIVGHCSIRKMLVTKAGKGFAGVVIADGDLDRLAARIVRRLGWSGPFELEFIRPPKGRHMLIEVNPRFPAWIDFPSQVGCNLPALLLDRACNLPREEKLSCPPGKLFIRHSIDLAGDIGDLAHMATTGVRLAPKSIGLLEAFK